MWKTPPRKKIRRYNIDMKDKNTKQRKQMIKRMSKNTPGYKFSGDNHFPVKELNFLESFMYFILAVFIGTVIIVKLVFPLIQRAVDIEALRTCENRGDCSEVIRDINR